MDKGSALYHFMMFLRPFKSALRRVFRLIAILLFIVGFFMGDYRMYLCFVGAAVLGFFSYWMSYKYDEYLLNNNPTGINVILTDD